MPTYEYGCEACSKTWEMEQRITEAPVKTCPTCGEPRARRLISGGTFMLKGGGWYADGYGAKPPAKSDSSTSKDSAASKDSSSGSSAGEGKPAASSAADS